MVIQTIITKLWNYAVSFEQKTRKGLPNFQIMVSNRPIFFNRWYILSNKGLFLGLTHSKKP